MRVSAAEGVRAAVSPAPAEIADGTVKAVLQDWELPRVAMFPAGRAATAKARAFVPA